MRLQAVPRKWLVLGLAIVGLAGLAVIALVGRGCGVETLGQWTQTTPSGVTPSSRVDQALVYDQAGGKVIMFGGSYAARMDSERVYLNDTWAYDPKAGVWTELRPTGDVPPARGGHSMAYDSDRGTVLVFGGYDHAMAADATEVAGLGDLWEYDPVANTWSELAPLGNGPLPWEDQAMVYDSGEHRLLVMGSAVRPETGSDTSRFDYVNELWAYDRGENAWAKLDPGGDTPPGLVGETLVYDPDAVQVLLFGGYSTSWDVDDPEDDFQLVVNNGLWAYDPVKNEWRDVDPGGDLPPGSPLPYFDYYQAIHKSVLLVQGVTQGGDLVSLMWLYDASANRWTRLEPVGDLPPVRWLASMAYCSDESGIVLYGGYRSEDPTDFEDRSQPYIYLDDLWVYSATTPAAE